MICNTDMRLHANWKSVKRPFGFPRGTFDVLVQFGGLSECPRRQQLGNAIGLCYATVSDQRLPFPPVKPGGSLWALPVPELRQLGEGMHGRWPWRTVLDPHFWQKEGVRQSSSM